MIGTDAGMFSRESEQDNFEIFYRPGDEDTGLHK